MAIDFMTYPKPSEPNTCHVVGYVENILGFIPDNYTLKAAPVIPYYNGSANVTTGYASFYPQVIPATGDTPAVSGYIDAALFETQTTGVKVKFYSCFTSDGIYREISYIPVIIPNIDQILFSDLLIPILNTL